MIALLLMFIGVFWDQLTLLFVNIFDYRQLKMLFGGKSFDPETDIPDLSGKVILVTGGNTGLGKESVLQLAKHNPAHIWLAARTASKAQSAISDVKKIVPDARITHLPLDLTSFSSIAEAARIFNSQSDRLDILLNNAGIMAVPSGTTKEGYEIQLGTNHVGHFLLTKLLLPTLQKTAAASSSSADVRIINLSSMGHKMAPSGGINFSDTHLPKSSAWTRYGQSKLANILFTFELARRYPDITSVSIHPGTVKTDLGNSFINESNAVVRGITIFLASYVFKDIASGTKNQLWAATAKDVISGAYYVPVGQKDPATKYARDEALARRLWDWSEKEVGKYGY